MTLSSRVRPQAGLTIIGGEVEVPIDVASYAALRALTTVPIGNAVSLGGRAAVGDRGGGIFVWTTDTVTTDDDGTVLVPTLGPRTGAYKRVYSGALDIRWFGATGNGVSDDAAEIQAALDSATDLAVYVPPGLDFSIGSQLVIARDGLRLFGAAGSRIKALDTSFDMIEVRANDVVIEKLELWGAAVDDTTTQYGIVTNAIPGYVQGATSDLASISGGDTFEFEIDLVPYTVTFQAGDLTGTVDERLQKILKRVNGTLGNGDHAFCCVQAVDGISIALASRRTAAGAIVEITGGTAMTNLGFSAGVHDGTGYRAERCTVREVKFYGEDSSTRLNNGLKVLAGCDYWRILDCTFQLMGFSGVVGNGYALNTGARGIELKGCKMIGDAVGGRHLIYMGGGARDCQIIGNTITNANANAINGTSLAYQLPNLNILVSNNTIANQAESADDFAFAGISLTGAFYNVLVAGNTLRDIGDQGVYFSGLGNVTDSIATPHDIVVRGNSIINCGKHGVNFETVTRGEIVDNLIVDAGKKTAATYVGIQVASYSGATNICDRVSVRGNRVLSSDRASPFFIYAVRFDPTATRGPSNSELIGNTLDPGSSGVLVGSSDTPAVMRRNHGTVEDDDVSITVGLEPWRECIGGLPGLPTSYTGLWLGPSISPTATNFAMISSGTTESYVNVPDSGGSLHFTVAGEIRGTVIDDGCALKDDAGNTLVQTSSTAKVGFFGATPITKPAVTGALSTVADAPAKAVLTSIVAQLVSLGLVSDGTT